MGKSHPAASLWEPEIEKILIVKSKCHRLGEDPEALKIDRSMQEGWVGRGRGQSEGRRRDRGVRGAMEPVCLLVSAPQRRPHVSVQMLG